MTAVRVPRQDKQGWRLTTSRLFSAFVRPQGEWLDSLKHGEGMFTFDDGSVYEGPFAYDKIAEPHRIMRAGSTAAANASAANRADTADESVRPRKNAADRKHGGAPRGRFGVDGSGTDGDGASGSASPSHSDASSAQIVPQLRLALDDVLPPEPAAAAPVGKAAAFVQTEQQRLEKLVFRYNSEFKAFYKQYSGVSTPAADAAGTAGVEGGSAAEGVFAMTLAQLWRFMCDIHVTPDLLPIASVNRILVAMRRQHVLEVEVAKQRRHARRQRKKQGGTAAMIKAGIIPPPPPPPPLYREAEQMPSTAAAAVTVTVSDPSDAPASPTRGATRRLLPKRLTACTRPCGRSSSESLSRSSFASRSALPRRRRLRRARCETLWTGKSARSQNAVRASIHITSRRRARRSRASRRSRLCCAAGAIRRRA